MDVKRSDHDNDDLPCTSLHLPALPLAALHLPWAWDATATTVTYPAPTLHLPCTYPIPTLHLVRTSRHCLLGAPAAAEPRGCVWSAVGSPGRRRWGFGGRESISLFCHTNEFCGK